RELTSFPTRRSSDLGWTPPTTWDDVMTIGEAAKSEDLALFPWGGQNASNYYQELAISMAIKEAGVDLQKRLDSLEEGVFEDDALVAAYAAIEDAVEEGDFLSGGAGIKHTEAQAQWVTGKAVMYPSGSWIENEQKGSTPEDYEMVGVPTPQLSSGSAMPPRPSTARPASRSSSPAMRRTVPAASSSCGSCSPRSRRRTS